MADNFNAGEMPLGFTPYDALIGDGEPRILVALSGGADSRALFDLTARYCEQRDLFFFAAHVNHGIRGDEALRDRDFCIALANTCPQCKDIFVLDADVPALAESSGRSIELEARIVRYNFFEKVMRDNAIPYLATAHNADDNAETLLLSLTRGCTLSGAGGIASHRKLNFGAVERPLLGYQKKDIVAFCNENSYPFVTDRTNSDVSYPRNRIRSNVLPELCAINPEFLAAFARFTESARLDSEFLDSEAEKFADDLEISVIAKLPQPIASRAIAIAAHRAGAAPEAIHVEAMIRMAKECSGSISLPGSVRAECREGRIVFVADGREKKTLAYPSFEPVTLNMGENPLWSGKIIISGGELTNTSAQIYNLSTSALINTDKIKGEIILKRSDMLWHWLPLKKCSKRPMRAATPSAHSTSTTWKSSRASPKPLWKKSLR